MDRLGAQMWALLVTLGWMCLAQAAPGPGPGPQYIVAIPSILNSGGNVTFCTQLLQTNETLTFTFKLLSPEFNTTLLQHQARKKFQMCHSFMAPIVPKDEVHRFQVEVTGQRFYSEEIRKVMIQMNKPVTFIQTDKPIYLPGQTVQFRVVSLDIKLRPACRKYDIIELEDVNGNRIGQWLNHTAQVKILQLSFSLSAEAKEGSYRIIVTSGEDKIYHNFKVEKYVLPKFEVKITADDQVSIAKEELSVKVCAKYTYGQPVPGMIHLEVCRPFDRYVLRPLVTSIDNPGAVQEMSPPCYKESIKASSDGCTTFRFPMSTFTSMDVKALQDTLEIFAKMEEEGTGTTLAQNKLMGISYVIGKLFFFDTPKVYEKDSTVEGKIKAVRFDDQPLSELNVFLFEGERWSSRRLQNLTTDCDGVATFSLDTSNYNGDIHLYVSDEPVLTYAGYRVQNREVGDITLSMAKQSSPDSKTVSSLEVKRSERTLACDSEEEISISYTVVQEERGPMEVSYMVIGNGDIIMWGDKKIVVKDGAVTEGSVSFKLQINAALVPDFVVVAFAVLPSTYVIANSAHFNTEKCFGHKVGIAFNPESGVPGEDASLQVTGHSSSLCGVSVIDQSVLIQEPDKHLKPETIYSLLPRNRYVPYQARDPTTCLQVRPKRSVFPYPRNTDDAFTVFQNIGLKIATNLMIRVPDCLRYMDREYHYGSHYVAYDRYQENVALAMPGPVGGAGFGGGGGAGPVPVIETVRTFFPETWIWDLLEIGDSGTAVLPVKVPDTITTWETEAFCLSPEGFGLAPRKEFTVFQPFFLELTLPYSIIRGEDFELKATVFNYLSSCMMVEVKPAYSEDFILTPVPGTSYTFCLCGNERQTVSWTLTATALGDLNVTVSAEAVASDVSCNNEVVQVPERGRIDRVTKKLKVKAEGVEKIQAHNLLLCPKGDSLTEKVDVKLPENMIAGSARTLVSVIGNILGRAMKNLDRLLAMPYGCGEQNMVLFAPNIYILEYLNHTGLLTSEIETKAKRFLTSGYQRQLNYKHHDGAYSAFGTGPGNTWLTAFVTRCFARAQKFIYIDPAKIEESRKWLESKQTPNGCFQKVGTLFNSAMKGGVSDEVTLTAYVSAALLEMGVPPENPVLEQSLKCLKASEGLLTNTYTTALTAYVFTLAGKTADRDELLSHLDTLAHRDGGLLHWTQTSADTAFSVSVEITSYVLLAKLGSRTPSAEELGYAAQIVRWLAKQQNYYGGFSSTQDTVVALQALALYTSLVISPEGQSTVSVRSPSGAEVNFQVTPENKLLYQEQSLPDTSGVYSVEATGQTCAAIQITAMYNVPVPSEPSSFQLTMTSESDCDASLIRARANLNIKAMFTGNEEKSNMVVIDLKLLSGFNVDTTSLNELKSASSVSRVDTEEDHVLIYLDGAPKDVSLSYKLVLVREVKVYRLKPAVVKIYDYYQPDDKVEVDYTFPCKN